MTDDSAQAVYCDVRQLLGYIRDGHGGVFRRVALSGLIDSADRPHKQRQKLQTTRVIRCVKNLHMCYIYLFFQHIEYFTKMFIHLLLISSSFVLVSLMLFMSHITIGRGKFLRK